MTPACVSAKVGLTCRILDQKMGEHDRIVKEIELIREERARTEKSA